MVSAGIKGVGAGAVEALVGEREANGPFKGLVDFCERIENGDVNKRAIEALVKCGAFDFTELPRGRLFAGIENAMGYAASIRKDKAAGQSSLFDMLGGDGVAGVHMGDKDLPAVEAWPQKQMLAYEKELIGFYISGHPLLACSWTLEKYNQCDTAGLDVLPERTRTRIGGLVVNTQKRFTKPKKPDESPRAMMSFRLDTLDGSISAVAFPEAYAKFGIHLQPDAAVMLCGCVRKDGNESGLAVDEIYPIDEVPGRFTLSLSLHVHVATWTEERMRELKDVIRRHPGKTPLQICLLYPDSAKVHLRASNQLTVRVSETLVKECEKIVDGIYVGTVKTAGLCPPPEPRWKRNGS